MHFRSPIIRWGGEISNKLLPWHSYASYDLKKYSYVTCRGEQSPSKFDTYSRQVKSTFSTKRLMRIWLSLHNQLLVTNCLHYYWSGVVLLVCRCLKMFHLAKNDNKVVLRSDFHDRCKLGDIDNPNVPLCTKPATRWAVIESLFPCLLP